MNLAFIPLYIKYIGIEAYGLIGLFAVVQAALNLLDMGMTPTLGREMARFSGGAHTAQSIRDLLRSIELITWSIALVIALGIWAISGWLASDWLRTEKLSTEVIAQAFTIMGLVAAIRFVETIYHSSISGLQQQVLLNAMNAGLATLRGLGAVAILVWVSPTLWAFFLWQGLVSILTIGILVINTYRLIPRGEYSGQFSWDALQQVWRFSSGMLGITVLSLLLTQVDKILLSKLLPLSEYGYYTISCSVAATIFMFIGPIAQAWYPRFCALHASNDEMQLAENYHKATQLVTVIGGSAAVVVIFFSRELLLLWTQNTVLAEKASALVSVLMLGNIFNGFMTIPYQMQLAHGWTSLTMKINMGTVLIIVPVILLVTPIWGALGAAWVWVGINVFYILIAVNFMYRRILKKQRWRWYTQDLLLPMSSSIIASGLVKFFQPSELNRGGQSGLIVFASIVTIMSAAMASKYMRSIIVQLSSDMLEFFGFKKRL